MILKKRLDETIHDKLLAAIRTGELDLPEFDKK